MVCVKMCGGKKKDLFKNEQSRKIKVLEFLQQRYNISKLLSRRKCSGSQHLSLIKGTIYCQGIFLIYDLQTCQRTEEKEMSC